MRHVFIINPAAGKQNITQTLWPQVEKTAAELGIAVEYYVTENKGHATQLAEQLAQQPGEVCLYAVGGDGTLNEVLLGAYRYPNARVACMPYGSGNDFLRTFGAKEDFMDVAALLQGEVVPIDLIETDTGVCVSITSTGLDANVAYNIPKYRRFPLLGGSAAYNLSVIECILRPLGQQLKITVDGQVYTGRFLISTVCNASYYGGGWCAAPVASITDGVLEVILVKKISRFTLTSIIGLYKKGAHFNTEGKLIPKIQKCMVHLRAKEVLIEPVGKSSMIVNADGECAPAPRLHAKVLPGAGRFVLPRTLVGAVR